MRSKSLAILLSIVLASGVLLAQATHVTTSGTLPTNCRVGDVYNKTGTSAGLYRCSATNTWTAVGSSGTGDVVGPSSATADRIAVFDGTTGKLLKDGGQTIAGITGGSGKVVQVVNTQTGAVATGSTYIPDDDTIPQSGEGDEYMTLAITPTSSSNILKIDVVFHGGCSQALRWTTVALFQDSNANALAAGREYNETGTAFNAVSFTHYMTAGTTSSTTFKVRAGGDINGASSMTFNGQGGSRKLGGVLASSITITELTP